MPCCKNQVLTLIRINYYKVNLPKIGVWTRRHPLLLDSLNIHIVACSMDNKCNDNTTSECKDKFMDNKCKDNTDRECKDTCKKNKSKDKTCKDNTTRECKDTCMDNKCKKKNIVLFVRPNPNTFEYFLKIHCLCWIIKIPAVHRAQQSELWFLLLKFRHFVAISLYDISRG